MEKPIKKIRILPKLAFLVALIILYSIVYLFFRINHDIVHYKLKPSGEHQIEAFMPEGHDLFMNTLIDESSTDDMDQRLQSKVKYHQRKKKSLDIIFLPFIVIEKWFWNNFY